MSSVIRRMAALTINKLYALSRRCLDRAEEQPLYETLGRIPLEYGLAKPLAKRLLLDGHFLNPGYYYRLQLFRAAIGSSGGDELGFVWRHNTAQCTQVLRTLGVRKVRTFFPNPDPKLRNDARRLAAGLRSTDDLLALEFPGGVPAPFLYDEILKRQRAATVDISDPMIEHHIWEFLSSIKAAEKLIEDHDPDLIAMSHAVTTQCAPLAWLGARSRIPVVTLYGNYGVPRFWRMDQSSDIYYGMDRPTNGDLDAIPASQADALADIGRDYLKCRLAGQTDDLGGRMAFAGGGQPWSLGEAGDARVTVAVYASNWFDFPHALGMSRFRDFLDWIEATLRVAVATPSVRWLFRAHPCDKWYGGMTLKNVMPKNLPEHIVLVPDDCPGSVVMDVADAVVTYHGTAAIEYAVQGKPVLIPDCGWYHDCGFAVYPSSREHYLQMLGSDWFNQVDTQSAKRRAEIFAGLYFCVPDWQAGATLPDDSDRSLLKERLASHLRDNAPCVHQEIALIREWMDAGGRGYHAFKMRRESGYSVSNVSN